MEGYLGQIMAVGMNFAPKNWALCQGQIMSIAQNTALFSLLGTTYGGDGRVTFGLPDLRGRSMVGVGQGPGLSNIVQGELGGVENVTLTTSQLPAHTHAATATSTLNGMRAAATANNPAGNMMAGDNMYAPPATPYVQLAPAAIGTTVTVATAGSSLPVAIRNPFLGLNVVICTQGIFPSRN